MNTPLTIIDANRRCWNCKHFAPDDRETTAEGDCCALPPRTPIQVASYAFPRVKGELGWCGEWERTDIDPGPYPEPQQAPFIPFALTMENTAGEMRDFAEKKEIAIAKGLTKAEILALIEESEEGGQ